MFAYRAAVDGVVRWASLVIVELVPTVGEDGAAATKLTWTEQVAVLVPSEGDGSVDLAHPRGGLQLRLNALALALQTRSLSSGPLAFEEGLVCWLGGGAMGQYQCGQASGGSEEGEHDP